MLTGLIFATEDATDRPDRLAATLPFGGATLIEFQARLLIAAGASHLLVAVERLTPELLGAINRIMRRGVTVDPVRSAVEAEAKLHPLARVLVLADGLVTTDAVIALFSGDGPDALLVTTDDRALPGLERVGANAIWAGVARLSVRQIAEVAAMPKEYDFASTLLRVTAQGGAEHIALPPDAISAGHGVEHDSVRLRERNDAVVAAHVSGRAAWIDRYVQAPIARRVLPLLVSSGIGAAGVAGVAAALSVAGLLLIAWRWTGIGMPLIVLANFGWLVGSIMSWMRDQEDYARLQTFAIWGGSAAAALLMGRAISALSGSASAMILAVVLLAFAAMIERAVGAGARRSWWGSPAAYPLILLPFVWAGYGIVGLGLAAAYAAASLASVIERLKIQP